MQKILDESIPELDNMTWPMALHRTLECLTNELRTRRLSPAVVILTGGASRMPFFNEQVRQAFPKMILAETDEPELYVATGLARWGRRRVRMKNFADMAREKVETNLEQAVRNRFSSYVSELSRTMATRLVEDELMYWLRSWRDGSTATLIDANTSMQANAVTWVKGAKCAKVMEEVGTKWCKTIEDEVMDAVAVVGKDYGIGIDDLKTTLSKAGPIVNINMDANALRDSGAAIADDLQGVLVGIGTAIMFAITMVLGALGPIGWLLAAAAWLLPMFGGRMLVMQGNLPPWARRMLMTDARLEDVRSKLIGALDEKLTEGICKNQTLEEALKNVLKSSIERRINFAVERAKLLIR